MTEVNVPYLRHNHAIDNATIRRDLWIILQAFLASKPFSEMIRHEWDEDFSPLQNLDSEFQEIEITKSLISACINIRILDDAGDLMDTEITCGTLWRDHVNAPEQHAELRFRDACNKVIHAQRVHWDVLRLDGRPVLLNDMAPTYITPRMYLYGSLHDRNWRAELDILAFIRTAATLVF